MGKIGYIEVINRWNGFFYRNNLCVNWNKWEDSLSVLKRKLINEFNAKILEFVNEPGISNEAREYRQKLYDMNHWTDIQFYTTCCYGGIIV